MGEEPAYAVRPAGVGEPGAVVSDLGEYPGAELEAEAGAAEDDLRVRVLGKPLPPPVEAGGPTPSGGGLTAPTPTSDQVTGVDTRRRRTPPLSS